MSWFLALEFAKVILSWPVIVLALGAIFFFRFKKAIEALIDRVAKIPTPWGGDILTTPQQAVRPVPEPPPAEAAAAPIAPGDTAALEAQIRSERARAALFEYLYLNTFLVPHTQFVLDWLAERVTPITYGEYDAWWMGVIVDPNERNRIIRALENHHLIAVQREQGNLISVTPKGDEYIGWRGNLQDFLARRLPPPPPAAMPTPPAAPIVPADLP